MHTLADFIGRSVFHAGDGAAGGSRSRVGGRGRDLEIRVPPGTRIRDDYGLLGDLLTEGQRVQVAEGGRGGTGNGHGGKGDPGTRGERRRLQLELRLFADIGLLGLPNAGKSSLLRRVSRANPKVAAYPFTTLHPQLGYVELEPGAGFILADIPGLIEGAAAGVGLGLRFLRHLERNRLLLHLVDASAGPVEVLVGQVRVLEQELRSYGFPALPRRVVLNKMDLLAPATAAALPEELAAALGLSAPVPMVSAKTGLGCRELCSWAAALLEEAGPAVQTAERVHEN